MMIKNKIIDFIFKKKIHDEDEKKIHLHQLSQKFHQNPIIEENERKKRKIFSNLIITTKSNY